MLRPPPCATGFGLLAAAAAHLAIHADEQHTLARVDPEAAEAAGLGPAGTRAQQRQGRPVEQQWRRPSGGGPRRAGPPPAAPLCLPGALRHAPPAPGRLEAAAWQPSAQQRGWRALRRRAEVCCMPGNQLGGLQGCRPPPVASHGSHAPPHALEHHLAQALLDSAEKRPGQAPPAALHPHALSPTQHGYFLLQTEASAALQGEATQHALGLQRRRVAAAAARAPLPPPPPCPSRAALRLLGASNGCAFDKTWYSAEPFF